MRVFRGRRGAVAGSFLAVLAIGSLALTGCTIERSDAQEQSSQQSTEVEAEEAQAPVISVDDGDEDVDPSESVIVKSMGDGLSKVTMTNEEGYEVESELSDDGRSWTTAETLGYNRTYTIKATDKNGETATASFSTATPAATTNVALSPLADSVVGVGQTIGFRFGSPVKDRQAAQDAITVTTSPKVEGGFYWLNNSELRWRPAEYWEPGTEVTVEADIYGKDLGGGVWGGHSGSM